MPVPIVTSTMSSASRPAPKRNSPHAAALASFSITTGRSTSACSRSRSGSSRHGRLGANTTLDRAESTKPAAATPTAPDLGAPGQLADHLGHRVQDRGGVLLGGVAPRAGHDRALLVDRCRGDLRPTDVDADSDHGVETSAHLRDLTATRPRAGTCVQTERKTGSSAGARQSVTSIRSVAGCGRDAVGGVRVVGLRRRGVRRQRGESRAESLDGVAEVGEHLRVPRGRPGRAPGRPGRPRRSSGRWAAARPAPSGRSVLARRRAGPRRATRPPAAPSSAANSRAVSSCTLPTVPRRLTARILDGRSQRPPQLGVGLEPHPQHTRPAATRRPPGSAAARWAG